MNAIRIPLRGITLDAELDLPDEPTGLVIFAHGIGSSRHSARDTYVAHALKRHHVGTLLLDMLTPHEQRDEGSTRELRYDIRLLTARLVAVTDWMTRELHRRRRFLGIGYFGVGSGAAAALEAAAKRPAVVYAVVSRGGRPDLAGEALAQVRAATLLIVGAADVAVLECNRDAYRELRTHKELAVVPGATHLFEEPETFEAVTRLACDWFARFLGAEVHALIPETH